MDVEETEGVPVGLGGEARGHVERDLATAEESYPATEERREVTTTTSTSSGRRAEEEHPKLIGGELMAFEDHLVVADARGGSGPNASACGTD